MTLEELQHEARQDLAVIDQERLDQESLKNQTIKAKWLEHRTKYDQLLIMRRADHQKLYRENGNTTAVNQTQRYMQPNRLI